MQKTRSDYKICPFCGAALDVGEACDCLQEKRPSETPQNARNGARTDKYQRKHRTP